MRYLLICILLFPLDASNQNVASLATSKRVELLINAEKYLGLHYRSKVENTYFDCSGFVKYIMSSVGKNVKRSSVSQIHDGVRVKDVKDARPGDIMVFKGRNARNNRPGHVGIVHHWSNDTLYFIHSSTSKGVTIDHLYESYYKDRFLQVRDVVTAKK